MNHIKRFISVSLACAIALCVFFGVKSTLYSEALSPAPVPTATLYADNFLKGFVKADVSAADSGYCNKNFQLTILENGKTCSTDEKGWFCLFPVDVKSSSAMVRISKDNYLARTIRLDLEHVNITPIDIWPGDLVINGVQDNAINMKDIVAIAGLYNTTAKNPNFNPGYDLNGDQAINLRDIMIIAAHFNSTASDYEGYVPTNTPKPTYEPAFTPTPTSTSTSTPTPTSISAPTPTSILPTPTYKYEGPPLGFYELPYSITTNITANFTNNDSADISVYMNISGDPIISVVKLDYWKKSNPGDITTKDLLITKSGYTYVNQITGLSPNTDYCFQVRTKVTPRAEVHYEHGAMMTYGSEREYNSDVFEFITPM